MTVVVSVQHGSSHIQLLFYWDSFHSHLVRHGKVLRSNVTLSNHALTCSDLIRHNGWLRYIPVVKM